MVTWPIRALSRNDISIGSTVFVGLTSVSDRPTQRQTTQLGLWQ